MRPILVITLIMTLFFSCQNKEHKTISIELSELTISDIHQAYTSGKYSSQDLVNAYLKRIANLNDTINAITYLNSKALETAISLDNEYKKTNILRPLHGIPILIKDNINVKGLPTTAGSLALKNYIPENNAFVIQKLIDAGAIILGKTNMAEYAFTPMFTESSTHGVTKNPYQLDYVTAGSSGGTGASISANFGVLGLGTDTGNSIRGPSSHCGLVGFRTSIGLSSISGIVPLLSRNDVVGPMCRTVEDATKLMQVMIGFDPLDLSTEHGDKNVLKDYTKFLKKDGLKGARIGVIGSLSYNNAHEEIAKLFTNALKDMSDMGAVVLDSLEIPNFNKLKENQWCSLFTNDIEQFLSEYVKNDTLKTIEDLKKAGSTSEIGKKWFSNMTKRDTTVHKSSDGCLDVFTNSRRIAFRQAIEKTMDSLKLDALVYPSWNFPPAKIASFEEGYLGDNSQVIAPHTGQPAFTIPMGFTNKGLPTGLQFLGRIYDEKTLIKLTYAYEQGTKHRKIPVLK